MISKPLATEYVLTHVSLTWGEAAWGYENQWIDWSCLSKLAMDRLSLGNEAKAAEVKLAMMSKNESTQAAELVKELAREDSMFSREDTQKKWLYLVLRWLFENRSQFSEPFAVVEDIFCDFGHPLEIAGFIRYMPPMDGYNPQEHTKDENEAHMLHNWLEYLISAERQYGLKGAVSSNDTNFLG